MMNGKVTKSIVAIILALALIMSDFAVLISYALDVINTTNQENVQFTAYFKDENGNKVASKSELINSENMKLYVEVAVKKEGYFNGKITLQDCNFKLKDQEYTTDVNKVEENTITLNQINAGSTVTLELDIEPIIEEDYDVANLTKTSKIKISGIYRDSEETDKAVDTTRDVKLNLTSPYTGEEGEVYLQASAVTNKVYEVKANNVESTEETAQTENSEETVQVSNVEKKRIVQYEIASKINGNLYPIKKSTFTISVPENVESVDVLSRGTIATNGDNSNTLEENAFNYDASTHTLTITIENSADEKGKISWVKDATDKIIVTFILAEDAQITESKVTSSIELYDSVNLGAEVNVNAENEIDGIIDYSIDAEQEIYKGNLYIGQEREISESSVIDIRYAGIAEDIKVTEGEASYISTVNEQNVESGVFLNYKSSKLNKEDLDKVLGESGSLIIKDLGGNIISTITKGTAANDDGIIEITYSSEISNLIFEVKNAENAGVITVNNVRGLTENTYSTEEIISFKELKLKGNITADKNLSSKDVSTNVTLNETVTEAKLQLSKDTLSTLQENEDFRILVTLKADNEKYDLYKNPTVKLIFPSEISKLDITSAKVVLENEEFKVAENGAVKKINEDGNIVLEINLTGTQSKYADIVKEGVGILIKANATVKMDTPSKNTKITMEYTNENGIEEKYYTDADLKLESQYGLLSYTKVTSYNEAGDYEEDINENDVIAQMDAGSQARVSNIEYSLINNFEKTLNNVEVIGRLAIEDEGYNTFTTTLNKLTANKENVKIYYTKDSLDAEQINWVEQVENLAEVKGYKAIISSIEPGEKVTLNVEVNLPEGINYGENAEISNTVNYSLDGQEKSKTSTAVFATEALLMSINNVMFSVSNPTVLSTESGVTVTTMAFTEAQINDDGTMSSKELNPTDTVREGQVITYMAEIANNSGKDLSNVVIDVTQTNGNIYGIVSDVDLNGMDYTEYRDVGNKKTFDTIDVLKSGESTTIEWYVIVNEDADENAIVFSDLNVVADGQNIATAKTQENTIEQAELAVFVKYNFNEEYVVRSDNLLYTTLTVKNLSEKKLEDVDIEINFSNNLTELDSILDYYNEELKDNISVKEVKENAVVINISEIEDDISINIVTKTKEIESNIEKEKAMIFAKSETQKEEYISNLFGINVYQSKSKIDVNVTSNIKNMSYVEDGEEVEITVEVLNNSISEYALSSSNIKIGLDYGFDVKEAYLVDDNNEKLDISVLNNSEESKYEVSNYFQIGKGKINRYVLKLKVNYENISKDSIDISIKLDSEIVDSIKYIISSGSTERDEQIDADQKDDEEKEEVVVIPDMPYPDEEKNTTTPDEGENGSTTAPSEGENGSTTTPSEGENGSTTTPSEGENGNTTTPSEGENGSTITQKYKLSGIVWLDENRNGARETEEKTISGVTVYVLNTETNEYVKDDNGKLLSKTTSEDGKYEFELENGVYTVVFVYDSVTYSLTEDNKENVDKSINSDAISKKITIETQEKTAGVTNDVVLDTDTSNVDMGLIENKTFDLELNKYINKVVVQNSDGTKTYTFDKSKTAKVEINSKYLSGSTVVIEYGITVKNTGDIAGYVYSIVDYIPEGLEFSSELNKDWYKADSNLYTTSLQDVKLQPGEEKEITLVLTKTMTNSNTGLISNSAEIYVDYNDLGISDKDSTAGNKVSNEDDLSSAEIIIGPATGKTAMYVISGLVIASIAMTIMAGYFIRKEILSERR